MLLYILILIRKNFRNTVIKIHTQGAFKVIHTCQAFN